MIVPRNEVKIYSLSCSIAASPSWPQRKLIGRGLFSTRSAGRPSCSGRNADRIKILVWDQAGLMLVHKRLENCKFEWSKIADGVMRISGDARGVFEGLDGKLLCPEEARRPHGAGNVRRSAASVGGHSR
ncbi:IS66 family insertion sequence element accessory protein TnpB [Bradyrhizobium iriomotense]|uniref:IS66 family insertion sequence element accessory protein TnpB n=1 Tax=Bradyrhizobium iriomotense TaxID=441950 RepID=UPI003D67AB1C